jgi:hypothetical protein
MSDTGDRISVRMYRQGLGDCFLLTFPAPERACRVLIDCGVILGTRDPGVIMTKVVEDIKATTGGRLDVLIATHEHWDHLSGFLQAAAVFKSGGIQVDNLWLAWTEDPANELANRLRAQRHATLDALRMALARVADTRLAANVNGLLEFFGEPLAAAGGGNTQAALAAIRAYASTPPRFCHPGEPPLSLPRVPGVRLFVLGPPEDEKRLKQSDPTVKGQEVYTEEPPLTAATAFLMAALHDEQDEGRLAAFMQALQGSTDPAQSSRDARELRELSFPFAARHRIAPTQAQGDRFFVEHYGFDPGAPAGSSGPAPPAGEGPARPDPLAWRRIDDDWLGAAGELALQLDSDTNNTSLALAIERVDTGQVLLFPGDAQVGNWLSWEDLSWSLPEADGSKREVRIADLLARTVLYKVGHHASHNATLRAKGLELMASPDLVAMIPVDHAMAVKKRWNMPFPPLRDRLLEKTRGRVMRVDEGVPKQKPEALTDAEWQAFQAQVEETELYIEFTV